MSRVQHRLRQLAATYFAFDPRSLGLFRIALGIALFIDLWQRYRGIDYWFTDTGLLPRKLLGGQSDLFSIFLLVSSHEGALALMLLCALVYACFTMGFLTRVAHVLALVCVVSLNSRAFVVENGGHLTLNLLTLWSLFLPLGRRFSVDALRARRERGVGELADRPVWSLAVCALLLQFAVIYGLNAAHKTGPKWQDGTAVHYVLQNDSVNTIVAVWLSELPPSVLQLLSHATIAIEFAAVLLILSPLWTRHARLVAVLLLPALHLGFALCLRLGVFSFAMTSFFALLLAPEHWQWLADRRRRRSERRSGRALARRLEPGLVTGAARTPWSRPVLRGAGVIVREAAVLLLMVAATGDLLRRNPVIPADWRFQRPTLLQRLVWIPRTVQSWRMFAPDPPGSIVTLSVEARTADGRIVDPLNEVAGRYPRLPERGSLPRRLGRDAFFQKYMSAVIEHAWLRSGLRQWILRHPRRTGRSEDRIVAFDVYRVTAAIAPPGSKQGKVMARSKLMFFPP